MITPYEDKHGGYDYFFYVQCDSCSMNYQMDFIYSNNTIKCPRCGKAEIIKDDKKVEWINKRLKANNNHVMLLNNYIESKAKTASKYKYAFVIAVFLIILLTMALLLSPLIHNSEFVGSVFTIGIIALWYLYGTLLQYRVDAIDLHYFEELKYNLSGFIKSNTGTDLNDANFKYKVNLFSSKRPNYLDMFDNYYYTVVSKDIREQFKGISLDKYVVNAYFSNTAQPD